jgi:hypothetical protein
MPEIIETKAHCNTCGGERNHKVLCLEESSWQHQESNMSGKNEYAMLKCSGCGSIKLRHREWYSDGSLVPTIYYYPSEIFRPTPKWLLDFLLEVDIFNDGNPYNLLIEIYVALQNDQRALAAMGIRALLESIMIEKIGDQGMFSENLNKFANEGYVSRIQRERLETILDAGHAAMHRLYKPSEEDLITLVDITESIVESIYIHGSKVERLKKRIPPRAKKTSRFKAQ